MSSLHMRWLEALYAFEVWAYRKPVIRHYQAVVAFARSRPGWHLGLGTLYVVMILLGRTTVPAGQSLAMVWPAAGVSVLWTLHAGRRSRTDAVIAAISVVALASTFNCLTGARPTVGVGLGVANGILSVATTWALGRLGDSTTLLTTRDGLYRVALAAAFGGAISAPVGAGTVILAAGAPASGLWMWVLRNATGIVMVIVVYARVVRPPRSNLPKPTLTAWRGGMVGTTAVVYTVVFAASPDAMLLFLLIPVSMWTALQADARTTALHTLFVSMLTVVASLFGWGPLGTVSPYLRASYVQAVVLVLTMVAMTLVIDREEREGLNSTLRAGRLASEAQATLLERIITALREGVFLVGPDGAIGVHNSASAKLLDLAPDDYGFLVVPESLFDPDGLEERPLNTLFAQGHVSVDVAVEYADGHNGVVALDGGLLAGAEGLQGLVIVRDVTEERRQTQELSNFAGVVAHDLRSPLTTIVSWVEVLGEEMADDAPMVALLERVSKAAARMTRLIDDLLAYSVTRGGVLSPAPLELQHVCEDVVAGFLDRYGHDGRPMITINAEAVVMADETAIRQVLANLIGNALKYTAPGSIPAIQISASTAPDGMVRVGIADRGIGLPPGEEDKVFDEFHRVAAHADDYVGTGLGLAICRRVVERHGGRIRAVRRGGGGTLFEFTLPACGGHLPGTSVLLDAVSRQADRAEAAQRALPAAVAEQATHELALQAAQQPTMEQAQEWARLASMSDFPTGDGSTARLP